MKQFIRLIFILLPLLNLSINGDINNLVNDSMEWELKIDFKITGFFKTYGDTKIRGNYTYSGELNGTIGFDEDKDFIYYYKKGKVNDFEMKFFNFKTNKNEVFNNKSIVLPEIEFIIRNKRNLFLEFGAEKLDISKLDKDINAKLNLPKSYGILKRKPNLKYRKGIRKGSNKISWREKLLYSKMFFVNKYNWTWANTTQNMQESHLVEIQLHIKIK